MLADEHEDNKLEISILQLRATKNEDRQKGIWLKNICRHTEQDHEYHFLKEVILKGLLDHIKHCRNHADNTALASSSSPYTEQRVFTYLWVCLITPARMCKEILSQLYEAHQGAVCTKQFTSLYTGQVW